MCDPGQVVVVFEGVGGEKAGQFVPLLPAAVGDFDRVPAGAQQVDFVVAQVVGDELGVDVLLDVVDAVEAVVQVEHGKAAAGGEPAGLAPEFGHQGVAQEGGPGIAAGGGFHAVVVSGAQDDPVEGGHRIAGEQGVFQFFLAVLVAEEQAQGFLVVFLRPGVPLDAGAGRNLEGELVVFDEEQLAEAFPLASGQVVDEDAGVGVVEAGGVGDQREDGQDVVGADEEEARG